MIKIYNHKLCYISNKVVRIIIVNLQGGTPSPLHEFVDTWHNKYVKKIKNSESCEKMK